VLFRSKSFDTNQRGDPYLESPLPSRIIYSPYTIPGEAEHKILDIYHSGLIEEASPIRPSEKDKITHILYGKDGDLLLLSMLASVDNIIVVRESFANMVDIEKLKYNLSRNSVHPHDFITIMSFVGNDFVPRHPSFKLIQLSMQDVFEAYGAVRDNVHRLFREARLETPEIILTEPGNGIIWKNMGMLIKELAKREIPLFGKIISANSKPRKEGGFTNPSELLKKSTRQGEGGSIIFSYVNYRKFWYDNAIGIKGLDWDPSLPNTKGDIENINFLKRFLGDVNLSYDDEDIEDMCINYLRMFSWIQRYYFYGDAKWDMYYPYHHAPLLSDLDKVLDIYMEKFGDDKLDKSLNDVKSENPDYKNEIGGDYNSYHQ